MGTAEGGAFGRRVATAASCCLGRPFRPQGRGVGGFDCVGLVVEALRAGGVVLEVPIYPMRGHERGRVIAAMEACGLVRVALPRCCEGDVVLAFPAVRQAHLGIRTATGIIEANAMLRRVAERLWEGGAGWHSAWRLAGEFD